MNGLFRRLTLKERSLRVFLCHSHADRSTVHILYSHLKHDGVDAWLDAEKLLPGQDWETEIRRAILKSDLIIVCLSREFNKQKGYRYKELKIALEKVNLMPDNRVFIVPARLEKCDMPKSLRRLHRVDLFETGGYKKLIQTLCSRLTKDG